MVCRTTPKRAVPGAGVITAIMHGQAYHQSIRLRDSRERLRICSQRRSNAAGFQASKSSFMSCLLDFPKSCWTALTPFGMTAWTSPQVRLPQLFQVTVLAPTGTIGFMMDCDTTGVEPDIALIKYKKLVGGGMIKIVNQTVPLALNQFGYSEVERESILAYLDENETIEGAPYLKDEHLPVFDCAFQAAKGTRSIAPMGHMKMMGAAQPFCRVQSPRL